MAGSRWANRAAAAWLAALALGATALAQSQRVTLTLSDAADDGAAAVLDLVLRDGRIEPHGWLSVDGYNRSQHPAAVTVGEVTARQLKCGVRVQVQSDPYAPGGPASYELELQRDGDRWSGSHVGTFIDQRVRGSVAGRAAPSLVVDAPDFAPLAANEHPRLIFRKSDLPKIQQRMATPEGRAMVEMLKTRSPLREASQVTDRHASWMAANWGALWQLTGDRDAAAKARAVLMGDAILKPMPPDRKDIHHATRLLGIALTYDLCHDAWDDEFRRLVGEYLHVAATDLAVGFNEGFRMEAELYDPDPAGHRNAIRMAAVGCAAMAIEGDVDTKGRPFTGLDPLHRAAERHVTNYLRLGITQSGCGMEGAFPRDFALANGILQYMHASRVARGRDLSAVNPYLLAGNVLASRAGGETLDCGLSSISIQASGLWPMGFSSIPAPLRPAMKWAFDRDAGAAGKQHYGCAYPYQAAYALAGYPFEVAARPPGESLPLATGDEEHGHFVLRDRWHASDDAIVELFLNLRSAPMLRSSQRLRGETADLSTGVLNVTGLGAAWLRGFYGPSRLNDAIAADLLYARVRGKQACIGMDLTRTLTVEKARPMLARKATRSSPFPHTQGRLPTIEEVRQFLAATKPAGPAPATRKATIAPRPGISLVRHMAIDLSGECGAPVLIAIVDRADQITAPWRLPLATPVASSSPGQFIAGDAAAANLAGRFLVPSDARLAGGQVPARGEYFLLLTLQRGPAPAVKVEGTGLNARVWVGKRTIAFDGREIVLGP